MHQGILEVSLTALEPQSDLLRQVSDVRWLSTKCFSYHCLHGGSWCPGMHNWVNQWLQYLILIVAQFHTCINSCQSDLHTVDLPVNGAPDHDKSITVSPLRGTSSKQCTFQTFCTMWIHDDYWLLAIVEICIWVHSIRMNHLVALLIIISGNRALYFKICSEMTTYRITKWRKINVFWLLTLTLHIWLILCCMCTSKWSRCF